VSDAPRRRRDRAPVPPRAGYGKLRHALGPQSAFSDDEIAAMHAPGGHFFAAQHTMERYQTAFYAPLVADLTNFGRWSDNGAQTADQRATAIWQNVLQGFTPPPACDGIAERLAPFIAARTQAGGIAAQRMPALSAQQTTPTISKTAIADKITQPCRQCDRDLQPSDQRVMVRPIRRPLWSSPAAS
jgi:hypothetical protein